MNFWKKLYKILLFPHIAIMISLIPISAVALAVAFLVYRAEHPISYACFVLSAYTLTVYCFRIPDIIRFVRRVKEENRLLNSLTTNAHLRVKISLYSTFYFNMVYSLFQLGLAIIQSSVLYYSLSAYYFLLALMRMYLLGYTRSNAPGVNMVREYKRYRFCGIVMLVLSLALSVMVTYTIMNDTSKDQGMIATIAMAAFTFTALTVAIVNVVKYNKYKSPVFSAAKDISLAVAVVSVLSLENSMLAAFSDGTMDAAAVLIMTASTGFAVMVFVIGLAIFMIVRANKGLKAAATDN